MHTDGEIELATFGAGSFWGTQKYFNEFAEKRPGVIMGSSVGYMNTDPDFKPAESPTYKEVSQGKNGYVFVVHLQYDSRKMRYEELVKHFFTFHDPTRENR